MAEIYKFFNSTMEDRRRYQAADMAGYWDSFLSSGVIHTDGEPTLRVTADDESMNINIDLGKAVLLGHLYLNTDDLIKEIEQSGASEDRYDRIVLRLDLSIENRYMKAFIKEGDEIEPPELTRSGEIYEVSLAQIHVKAGKSFLEQSDIIDERLDEDLCGLASSLVTVPTDIFTEEWEEFVAEYNRWFADIQDSSYATVEDVRKSENNMKREIANLNLHLEANKRVKNGVTFGTNFADSFGMDIDMARTSSDDALTVGQTEVTVKDASEFKEGTEVTIFDDVSLERKKIVSISGNILTLETALTKDYKEGVNVARSMSAVNKARGNMEFGVWRTYNYEEVNNHYEIGSRKSIRGKSLAYINGHWFISFEGEITKVHEDEVILTLNIEEDNNEGRTNISQVNIESIWNYLIVSYQFYDATTTTFSVAITVFDENLIEVSEVLYSHSQVNATSLDKEHSTFFIYSDAIRAYRIDKQGELSFIGMYENESLFFTNHHIPVVVNDDETYSVISSSRTQLTDLKFYSFDTDMSLIKSDEIDFSSTTANSFRTVNLMFINNKYVLTAAREGLNQLYRASSIDGGETWVIEILAALPSASQRFVYMTTGGDIYVAHRQVIGPTVHKYVDGELVEVAQCSPGISESGLSFYDAPDGEYTSPFFLYNSSRTALAIFGDGLLGYGDEIKTNDVRFTTRPSREIVTWIDHSEDLTISEATFGNINLDLSTLDNETQAVGYTTTEQDEVRFTMTRQSVDDDVKITRILGGTS